MRYAVWIAPPAVRDAIESRAYIAQQSPEAADGWYEGLLDAIDTLALHPRRCPKAVEAKVMRTEVRQLLYKSHRILFTIEGPQVRVQHIRHAARRAWQPR